MEQNKTVVEQLKDIELKRISLQAELKISNEILENGNFSISEVKDDFLYNIKTMRWKADFYGRELEYPMMLPLTWFDMFREKYLPEFLTNKFPIKKRKLTFKFTEIFPDINVAKDRTFISIKQS